MTTLTKNHKALTQEVAAHIAADAVVSGHYWYEGRNAVGGTGCFIGCLSHGDDARVLTERFGLPLPLVKICESIFEALPDKDGQAFFAAIPSAVGCDGKDLNRVHWQFLAEELRAIPQQPAYVQSVIDPVISGMFLLANGKKWPDAADAADAAYSARAAAYSARAAADAARAARAAARAARAAARAARADDAARAAADAAAYAVNSADAARADDAAALLRQRDAILRLISSAPVGETQ